MNGFISVADQHVAISYHRLDYAHPAREAPAWSTLVERWSQLDAYAFGLPSLFATLGEFARPDFIFLASPEASNRTDYAFAAGGASSPSKFVHTLPNSRSAALLQLMQWQGPLLCLQSDPTTLLDGLREAALFACGDYREVWLFSVERRDEQDFSAHLFRLHRFEGALEEASAREIVDDQAIFDHLRNRSQNPSLAAETVISKDMKLRI